MSWRCEYFESRDAIVAKFGFIPVGAIWPALEYLDSRFREGLSASYIRDHEGKRPPLYVQLPSGPFCIDAAAYDAQRGYHGDGWTVTGVPPALTVQPSINAIGHYHGYITAGVITDDCEGRTFPDARGLP